MGEHHHPGRIEGAAKSLWAEVIAKFIIPALVVMVGVIGTYVLNSLSHSNESIWTKLADLQNSVAAMHETLSVIDSRMLTQTENQNQQTADIHNQLDDHEHRIRGLESRRH